MRIQVAILLVMTMTLGCGTKRKKPTHKPETAETAPSQAASSGSQNPFGNLSFFGSMLSEQLDRPGPYDELRQSEGFDEDAPHFVVIELSGDIVEMKAFSWFSPPHGVELRALETKLDKLAADDKVRGLILRGGELSLSMAAAEELRAALVHFKGGGARKLACHVEGASNVTYFVLSACDSLALAPTGQLVISGIIAMPIHLKGLLTKLGVRADFVHIGAYKGAAEPLTRDSPSDEMRETIQAIIDSRYDTMIAGIAEGRGLEPDVVNSLVDIAIFQPEQAVQAKLVDDVAVFSTYRDQIVGDGQWFAMKLGAKGPPDISELMEFIGVKPRSRPSEPHVALVYALGDIVDGKGEGILGARKEIASRPLTAAIHRLTQDDKVKAIVLRIDSGGGSALASELILNALDQARAAGKPVIVSMGGVAASGGYYIACHSDKVFAQDNTLTGSIGVVGGKLTMREALDKIGVAAFPMARGKRALMYSMLDPWTDEEREVVRKQMEIVYKVFVNHVADGRKKSYDEIHAIAQGRVWTGSAAKENGLVDEIGGLDAAVAEARKMAGVDEDTELEVYPPEPTLMDLMGSLGEVQAPLGLALGRGPDNRVAVWLEEIAQTLGVPEARTVASTLRTLALLQDSHILAATIFPVAIY